jgi:hypothetical protein
MRKLKVESKVESMERLRAWRGRLKIESMHREVHHRRLLYLLPFRMRGFAFRM